jgi:predicted amidohydrolase
MDGKLCIATCQFPVCGEPAANGRAIRRLIRRASEQGADLVHFSETALSGYGNVDVSDLSAYDWDALRRETAAVQRLAAERSLWVVLGSMHFVAEDVPPTNCLYVIDPSGEIVDRYDKCMLTGGDRKVYTAGDHPVILEIEGIRCGLLICYDSCYPEMYNRYVHRGVELVLHSFYNARHKGPDILDEFIPAQIQCRAADNAMWVVANNSSARHSCWASLIVRPDGSVAQQLKRHVSGLLLHRFPDPHLKGWIHNRKPFKAAPDEVYHLGAVSDHPRVRDHTALP